MKFQPGDVIMIMNHGSWVSRAIAWFMKSRWSHAALIIEHSDKYIYMSETSDYEVVVHVLDDYLNDPKMDIEIWRPKFLSDKQKQMVVEECMNNLGVTYGYLQFISFGLRRLLMRVGINIRNFIRQGMVCSSHVMYGYCKTSVSAFNGIDPEAIDTEEFYQKMIVSKDGSGRLEFEKVWVKC